MLSVIFKPFQNVKVKPDIKWIYRQDYLKHMGRAPVKKSYVDGVVSQFAINFVTTP